MIRVTGLYRWSDGATFDHEYYNSEHMRITKEALKPHGLLRLESDRFIFSEPSVPGEIIAASNAYFPSVVVAQVALAAAGAVLMADVPKYTNLKPEIRLSAVTSHVSPSAMANYSVSRLNSTSRRISRFAPFGLSIPKQK
ncbi:MAG: hypothetical protein NVS9B15_11990 [Acidobacteriaceae bacterium]